MQPQNLQASLDEMWTIPIARSASISKVKFWEKHRNIDPATKEALHQLEEFGVEDMENAYKLCIKYNNNIERVIEDL